MRRWPSIFRNTAKVMRLPRSSILRTTHISKPSSLSTMLFGFAYDKKEVTDDEEEEEVVVKN